jgi:hypothetical protein
MDSGRELIEREIACLQHRDTVSTERIEPVKGRRGFEQVDARRGNLQQRRGVGKERMGGCQCNKVNLKKRFMLEMPEAATVQNICNTSFP